MEQGGKLKEQLSITIYTYSSTRSKTNSGESTTNATGHTAIICSVATPQASATVHGGACLATGRG